MANDNHVAVRHKHCGFQGRVGGRVVVKKEPVVVEPKLRSFSSHIFSQASQNITVKDRADRSVRKNKFTVNVEKKKTMSMLFVELRTCRAIFVLGDCCFVSGS
jgi:hypothetical protein